MGSSQHPVHVEGRPGSLHQRVVWHGLERNSDCKAAVAVSVGQSEPESVRAHREVLLAGILHMYWCGRSEHTTRCHRQDMAISRWLEAPVVVS